MSKKLSRTNILRPPEVSRLELGYTGWPLAFQFYAVHILHRPVVRGVSANCVYTSLIYIYMIRKRFPHIFNLSYHWGYTACTSPIHQDDNNGTPVFLIIHLLLSNDFFLLLFKNVCSYFFQRHALPLRQHLCL